MSVLYYNRIGELFSTQYDTTMGQMFGKPCIKINNKAFASFYKEAMVFKLGKDAIHLVKDNYIGSENWDPSGKGRPMKDWLQVPATFANDWEKLAKEALQFIEENS